jgi:glucose/arabinose dehydrogenase
VRRLAVAGLLGLALTACGSSSSEDAASPVASASPSATATPSPTPTGTPTETATPVPERRTVATGLDAPWGLAFLPNEDALVAERDSGRILRIPAEGGKPRREMTVPGVAAAGEGGLLGLAVSPDYADDGLVYAYLTSESDNRIVRFRLGDDEVQEVVTGLQKNVIHNGGRIAFGPDGKLYAGVGDAGETANAQDRGSENGKILRMDPDGGVPDDNPFSGSRVWSWGHRNVQGLAWDADERLWASEFGQDTYDEVNSIRRGRNYGWPEVEGEGPTEGGRFLNPLVTWSTSEASPSGAAIIGANLYVAALRGECVWRIPIEAGDLGQPRQLLAGTYGRIRTVAAAPDGTLWVATSNTDGRGSPGEDDDRIIALRV